MTSQEENKLALSHDFKPELDKRRGGKFCKFSNDNIHVWQCVSTFEGERGVYWRSAVVVDNLFTDHETHRELKDAFNRFNEGE